MRGATMGAIAAAVRQPFSGSHRKIAVAVGLLFLSSTTAFMIGSSLLVSYFSGDSPAFSTLVTGVLLEIYCGLAVAALALIILPVLSPYGLRLARSYAGLRIAEFLAIVFVGTYMLTTKREFPSYDAFIYVFTATGGIVVSYLLYKSRLVPRVLSTLGLVGYVLLAIGIPITVLGSGHLDSGWGLVFVAPGGLFELALPLLLLVKGFSLGHDGQLPQPRPSSLVATSPATP
jgi:Domain of unknown function (DUF4386)